MRNGAVGAVGAVGGAGVAGVAGERPDPHSLSYGSSWNLLDLQALVALNGETSRHANPRRQAALRCPRRWQLLAKRRGARA
jgi:hypothetical protein